MVHLSERELELPDAVIANLLKLASEDKDVISISAGEPNFDLPAFLQAALKKLPKTCNHYAPPGGRKDLKELLLKKLEKDNGIIAAPENIIVTAGSQEAILLGAMCSLDIGEQVILPDPGFMGYLPCFELLHAVPVALPLLESDGFSINPDVLSNLIDKKRTKVIMLNTPSNPTGTVLSKKILEEIADIVVENNVYVFSDEAYEHIVYDQPHISIGSLNGMEDYTVSLYTFSKSYAMCGFRVGYAVGPKPLIDAMTKAHIYTTLSAPNPSQMLAKEALGMPRKYIQQMVDDYRKRRDFLVRRLCQMGLPTLNPEGAFYTFSNIQDYSTHSFKFAGTLLKKAQVAVVPGREFGRYGEGYIRCSYATKMEQIAAAMERLEKFLHH